MRAARSIQVVVQCTHHLGYARADGRGDMDVCPPKQRRREQWRPDQDQVAPIAACLFEAHEGMGRRFRQEREADDDQASGCGIGEHHAGDIDPLPPGEQFSARRLVRTPVPRRALTASRLEAAAPAMRRRRSSSTRAVVAWSCGGVAIICMAASVDGQGSRRHGVARLYFAGRIEAFKCSRSYRAARIAADLPSAACSTWCCPSCALWSLFRARRCGACANARTGHGQRTRSTFKLRCVSCDRNLASAWRTATGRNRRRCARYPSHRSAPLAPNACVVPRGRLHAAARGVFSSAS